MLSWEYSIAFRLKPGIQSHASIKYISSRWFLPYIKIHRRNASIILRFLVLFILHVNSFGLVWMMYNWSIQRITWHCTMQSDKDNIYSSKHSVRNIIIFCTDEGTLWYRSYFTTNEYVLVLYLFFLFFYLLI